jgi:aquaporin Z
VFVGGWAIQQLWLFWLAPIAGAALAGIVYPLIAGSDEPVHEVVKKAGNKAA